MENLEIVYGDKGISSISERFIFGYRQRHIHLRVIVTENSLDELRPLHEREQEINTTRL